MSLLRQLFNPAFRRARAAEAAGDHRRAAALYVEADAPDEAANALLVEAVRARTLEARLAAYEGALRWLAPGSERATAVEGRLGLAVLDDARAHGLHDPAARERLRGAAARLERVARHADAAAAWELLGETEEAARCFAATGDLERLEALLEAERAGAARRDAVRGAVADYEAHLAYGARLEALAALERALAVDPAAEQLASLATALRRRIVGGGRLGLRVGGRAVRLVGRLPAVLGRGEADVGLRGPSLSRRHAAVEAVADGGFAVRDLGSRNGTKLAGVPVGAVPVALGGPVALALGDVELRLVPAGPVLEGEVVAGPDRGLAVRVGAGPLEVPGAEVTVRFDPRGVPHLTAPDGVWVGGRRCTTPVVPLDGEVLRVGALDLEVHA